MLAFTPAVDNVLAWFELTYAPEVGFGSMQWKRNGLPYAGGVADQPAKLMEALAYVALLRNSVIAEELDRRPGRRGRPRERRG